MPADLHKSLEECETNAKSLIQEMQQYKASRVLNQTAAEALDKVTISLASVIKEIEPLTGVRIRQFVLAQTIAWGLTTVLVIALLVLIIVRKP